MASLTAIEDLTLRLSDVVTLPAVGADSPGVVVRLAKGTQIGIFGDLSGLITNNTLNSCKLWLTVREPTSVGGAVVVYKDSPLRGIALTVAGTGGTSQTFIATLLPADSVDLDRDQYRFDIRLQLPSGAGPYVLVEGVLNFWTPIGEQTPRA
jgi:hypothetical protein